MWWSENLVGGIKTLLAGINELKTQAAGSRLKSYHEPSALLQMCVQENLTIGKGLKKWRSVGAQASKL
jgi:hypothetical protein